jgi:nitronate monooxygenase
MRHACWERTDVPARFTTLVGVEHALVQAPMAGASTPELAAAVCEAGGLGSLACALLGPMEIADEVAAIRARTDRPLNLNFFCHREPAAARDVLERWIARLEPYYAERGLERARATSGADRLSFDEALCEAAVAARPAVVSFHFGLPPPTLVARVKEAGCLVISSATTVAEARYLADHGCDAIIAQGAEAGGHRGMFLTDDAAAQVGTMALVPQVVDAVDVPVIAAGGIGDARGIVAALALGASAVQLGTAYLRCPETTASPLYRERLERADDDATVLTNVFTGRPARGLANRVTRELGPLSPGAPPFPLAAGPLLPLRAAAEPEGSADFSAHLAGQAAPLARALPAAELTRALVHEAAELARGLGRP